MALARGREPRPIIPRRERELGCGILAELQIQLRFHAESCERS
jgi:hypothetical protein